MKPSRISAAVLVASAALALGCGGGQDEDGEGAQAAEARSELNGADTPRQQDFPQPKPGQTMQELADSIGTTGTQVAPATTVYTPGHNRVAFGVLSDNRFVYAPTALYIAPSADSTEIAGPYTAPADLLITEPAFRSQQAATEEDPFAAVYQAPAVDMEEPGRHVLLVVSKIDGKLVAAPSEVRVRKDSPVPEVGERAPKVETDTVASAGGNVEAIDTRRPPAPELHQQSFDDVVGKKPVALLFATPQLCQSRVCGPVVDIALQLKQKFGDRVAFIHQEVFVDNNAQKGLREPLQRFGLPTEPWLFTVDTDGKVAARLEGSFGLEAFEKAVEAAIARSSE